MAERGAAGGDAVDRLVRVETEMRGVDAVHAVGVYRHVLIVVGYGAPTADALEGVRREVKALMALHGGGIGVFGVAYSGMPMGGAAERHAAGELLRDVGANALAVASVIEGTGFWAETARSVMTTIASFARRTCPFKIFGAVNDGAAWIAPLLGPGIRASSARDAVAVVRGHAAQA